MAHANDFSDPSMFDLGLTSSPSTNGTGLASSLYDIPSDSSIQAMSNCDSQLFLNPQFPAMSTTIQSTQHTFRAPTTYPVTPQMHNTDHPSGRLAIVGLASHSILLQAGNLAHSTLLKERDTLKSENQGLKTAYAMLLTRIRNVAVGSEGGEVGTGSGSTQPSIVGLVTTKTEWAELNRKDYPFIQFWTKESYRGHKREKDKTKGESGIKDAEKVRRGKNANLSSERESMAFLQHEDGTPVLEEEAQAIANSMRKVFNDLLLSGLAPSVWTDASSTATKYLYQEMYRLFQFLQFCKNHWKVEKLASLLYSNWHRKIREAPAKVKSEPQSDIEGNDSKPEGKVEEVGNKRKAVPALATSPSGAKPTKQAKTATEDIPSEVVGAALAVVQPVSTASPSTTQSDGNSSEGGTPTLSAAATTSSVSDTNANKESIMLSNADMDKENTTPILAAAADGGTTKSVVPTVKKVKISNPLAGAKRNTLGNSSIKDTNRVIEKVVQPAGVQPALVVPPVVQESVQQPQQAPAVPPSIQVPKKDLYKFSETNAVEWNLFGAEYAPAQAVWPTKDAVKAVYDSLAPEDKETWKKRRKDIIAARRAAKCSTA
ncbi:hypothetical protein FA13DRAFT_1802665 [Coprinellus micaceus]|uniref:Uncharacterized protein n=1 Tax=Coprinellus micaceus TaxID=71717 RepID=A0A4Y7SCL8_COPMI|nr:hypothetical protein FA13DRAFT_1802665 [Coprinellus micaceus]